MNRNYFIIIVGIAIFCLFLIFAALWWEIQTPIKKENYIPPPVAPYKSYISGVGILEPSSGNIFIGTPLNRIVEKILVNVGEKVKKGQILIHLDDRDLQANLRIQYAAYKSTLAKFKKLEAFPRPEDLEEAKATLKKAQAELDFAKNEYERIKTLTDVRALSEVEKIRRYYNYQEAEAAWLQAKANLDKIKAGTWHPDLEIARYAVQEAQANLQRVKTEIERTIIRSPIDGTILQINIHEGEFPPPDTSKTPMMILGNIDAMNIRVSINQLDIPYFQPEAPATAYSQGDARTKFPLEFLRIEPYLSNKQNFTNQISEMTDTRVLRIIYHIKNDDHPIFVGEQMDVFIETKQSQ